MTRNPLHSGLDNYNGAEFRPTSSCSWTRTEFLMSHVYDVLLLLLVCCLAAMNRNVKRLADRNWGETKWLLTTGLLCLPVWIGWMVAVALLPVGLLDTAVVIASLTSATLILSLMFGPKLFILISYHPVADPSGRVPSPDRLSSAASTTTKSSMASTLGSIRSKSPPQLVFAPNVSQPPKGNAADCRADDNFTSLSHA